MKYVFVIHGLPIGGAEKFLISLLHHFTEKRIDSYLILLSDDISLLHEVPDSVSVVKIKKSFKIDLSALFLLRRNLEFMQPDLIICINPYAFFIVKCATFFSHKYRICLSPHSTVPFNFKNKLQTYLYYSFFSSSDLIIFLCKTQKEYLVSKFPLRKSPSHIINNGIDLSYFQSNQDYNYLKKNDLDTSKIILYVARLSPEKRHQDAIEVLKNLNIIHNDNIHLHIVGDGLSSYTMHIRKLVEDNNLSNFVHFMGSQRDVRPFYDSADLFLMTSSSETFSIAAIEAMSFGLPCVLTDVGGSSEIIMDDFNGYLCQPGNIIDITEKCSKALHKSWDKHKIISNVNLKYSKKSMLDQYDVAFSSFINS
jgi:glycosyltransferase involved in cell wall biosynthesis